MMNIQTVTVIGVTGTMGTKDGLMLNIGGSATTNYVFAIEID